MELGSKNYIHNYIYIHIYMCIYIYVTLQSQHGGPNSTWALILAGPLLDRRPREAERCYAEKAQASWETMRTARHGFKRLLVSDSLHVCIYVDVNMQTCIYLSVYRSISLHLCMCMCRCICYMCSYIYIYVYIYICVACLCICMSVCICICVCIHICVCICCMCLYWYLFMYMCMCICIRIYIHTCVHAIDTYKCTYVYCLLFDWYTHREPCTGASESLPGPSRYAGRSQQSPCGRLPMLGVWHIENIQRQHHHNKELAADPSLVV